MPESFATAGASHREKTTSTADDVLTIAAISVIAAIVSDVLHEGVGHGLIALLSGANSGLLTTVAWSSEFDSRLVEAGGTLVNLAAALALWLALRNAKRASMALRYFLLITCAFNLLTGTGYFLFSGITDFGDWAAVIRGMHPHVVWRTILVAAGAGAYYLAARVIGVGIVRYVGIPREAHGRLRKFTIVPYLAAVALACVAGLWNPGGIRLVLLSALPATAGGHSGLLWLQYSISEGTVPKRSQEVLGRSYVWVIGAAFLAFFFIAVLGRGVNVHR